MQLDRRDVGILLARKPQLAPLAGYVQPKRIAIRTPDFAGLAHIVVEQAVSQASAQAVWTRVVSRFREVTPRRILEGGVSTLKACGLSKTKAECLNEVAAALVAGRFELEALAARGDDEVRERLTALRGIGRWTADIYLLLALQRTDVWPSGDLALREAVRELWGLAARPSPARTDALGECLRPVRSTAAVLLWEYYLATRGGEASPKLG